MKTLDVWLSEYSADHQHPKNIAIHKLCIPLIMYSLLGLLFAIPFPLKAELLGESLLYNWAALLIVTAFIFYLTLSLRDALLMLGIAALMLCSWAWIATEQTSVVGLAATLFGGAWVLQFWGHKIEGQKPSFFTDLKFLLIGPLWTLHSLLGELPAPDLQPKKGSN